MAREISQQQIVDLQVTVAELDPAKDEHWLGNGTPSLAVLKKRLDWNPSQKEVKDFTAGFTRDHARFINVDEPEKNAQLMADLVVQGSKFEPYEKGTASHAQPKFLENGREPGAAEEAAAPEGQGPEVEVGLAVDVSPSQSGRPMKSPQRRALETAEANDAIGTLQRFIAEYGHEHGVYREAGGKLSEMQGVMNAAR